MYVKDMLTDGNRYFILMDYVHIKTHYKVLKKMQRQCTLTIQFIYAVIQPASYVAAAKYIKYNKIMYT